MNECYSRYVLIIDFSSISPLLLLKQSKRNHIIQKNQYVHELLIFLYYNLSCHLLGSESKRMETNGINFVSNNLRLLLGRKPHSWHQ